MSNDLVILARKRKFKHRTHYPGCEAVHFECLVGKLRNEVERLKALLTPEQFGKLPRSTRGDGGRGNFGGGPGFGGNFDPNAMLERLPEEQRKQFLDAVDKNKNGKIDDDERDGIREYMRQQFGNMGGGGRGGRGGEGGGNGGGNRRGPGGGRGNNEV